MAVVRSNRLVLTSIILTASNQDLYEAPALTRTIIKNVVLQAGSSCTVRVGVRDVNSGSPFMVYALDVDLADGERKHFEEWNVLLPGDVLFGRLMAGSAPIVWASGAELFLNQV